MSLLRALLGGEIFASTNDVSSDTLVVGLHGWARDSGDFAGISSFLGQNSIAFVALDLPGFGHSLIPPSAWDSMQYAGCVNDAIEELVSQMNPSRVFVVGHSFGGRIAVNLASLRPQYLNAIAVMGTPLFRATSASAKIPAQLRLAKSLASRSLLSPERLDRIKSKYGSRDYRLASGIMRDVLVRVVNEDYSDLLGSIQVETKFIWGELDTAAPIEQAKLALTFVKGSSLAVVNGGDHFAPLTDPIIIEEWILGMVAEGDDAVQVDSIVQENPF